MFEAFDNYIEGYRQVREAQLLDAKQARADWLSAARSQVKTQRLVNIVPDEYRRCFNPYSLWDVSDKAMFLETSVYVAVLDVYTINCVEYKVVLASETKDAKRYDRWRIHDRVVAELDELPKFLADRKVSKSDYSQVEGRSIEWCKERAVKDAAAHSKAIEQKVQKMIGDVVEILETFDGWYLNGSNGKQCHMWFISAGGYAVQCLHTRCLVKEVKL